MVTLMVTGCDDGYRAVLRLLAVLMVTLMVTMSICRSFADMS